MGLAVSSRTIPNSYIAVTVAKRSGFPVRALSPQNSSGPRIATMASLPKLENEESQFSPCSVNRSKFPFRVSLRVDDLIFFMLNMQIAVLLSGK